MKATEVWENFYGYTILGLPYLHETKLWNKYTRAFMKCNKCWYESDKVANQKPSCINCKRAKMKKIDMGDYISLELSTGQFTKIDKEDLDKIKNNIWYLTKRNSVEARKEKLIKIHRVIMWAKEWEVIDHVNGDFLDNRKGNLRKCSQSENMCNTKKRIWTSSKYKWVSWSESKKLWVWRIVCKKKVYQKSSKNEISMALWYDEMAENLFWEFSRTNKKLWLV